MDDSASPLRILVVEDEARLASVVQRGLMEQGFVVEIATDGETALRRVVHTTPDLAVLDVVLPGIDGFEVCRQLRQRSGDLPILMLSARGVVSDRVQGLESGADDYLTKPFALAELVARVRALLRRRRPSELLVLSVGDVTLDPVKRTVRRA